MLKCWRSELYDYDAIEHVDYYEELQGIDMIIVFIGNNEYLCRSRALELGHDNGQPCFFQKK